jgi:mannose-1-phosphate guanylyltransferase
MKVVILAGGYGTRLYPLSTVEKPKQFINLIGEKTLFQQTVARLDFLKPEDIFVATNKEYIKFVKEQAPEIPNENIFEEPAMRNTATCIGYAAIQLEKISGKDEVMAIIYADHLVRDKEEFAKKLKAAEKLAKEETTLNIIEVKAEWPNTKLGYVQIGKLLRKIDDVEIFEFKKFKEKPDEETAKKYIESGEYLWNTGFYVWKIGTILDKYKEFAPDTYEKLTKNGYEKCENISIDYAIMEKLKPEEVRIIPATLGWSDIGTWETLFKELEKNGETEKIEKFKKIRPN